MAAFLISKMAAIKILFIIIMDIKLKSYFSGYTYIFGVVESFKLLTG